VAHDREHPDDVGGDRPDPLDHVAEGGPEVLDRAHVGLGVVDGAGPVGPGVVLGLVHEADEQPLAEGGQAPGGGVDGGVEGAGGDVGPAGAGPAEDPVLPALEQDPAAGRVRLLLGGRPAVVPVVVAVQDVDPAAVDGLPGLDLAGGLPG